jgi:hypothetical protein
MSLKLTQQIHEHSDAVKFVSAVYGGIISCSSSFKFTNDSGKTNTIEK